MNITTANHLVPTTPAGRGRAGLAFQSILILVTAAFLWTVSQSPGAVAVWLIAAIVGLTIDPAGKLIFPAMVIAVATGIGCWSGVQMIRTMPDQIVVGHFVEFIPALLYLLRPFGIGLFFFLVPTAIVAGLVRANAARSWRGGFAVVVAGVACFIAFFSLVAKASRQGMTVAPPLKVSEEFWNETPLVDLGDTVVVPPSRPVPDYDVRRGESYGPHGFRNTLDLYLPRQDVKPPVVIYLHGGGIYSGGTDGQDNGLPEIWRNAFLARGLAVAELNYRLAAAKPNPSRPEVTGPHPAQIQDCLTAVRFLRAEAERLGVNGANIGVMGHSYGGGLAALMGVAADRSEFLTETHPGISSRVQAVVNSAGMVDHRIWAAQSRFAWKMLNLPSADYTSSETAFEQYFHSDRFVGRRFDPNDEAVMAASAITQVRSGCPPFLNIYGMRDTAVPPIQGDLFHGRLRKAGVSSKLVIIPGAGHGLADVTGTGELMAEFLASQLNVSGRRE
jgi:acetyl esterase/lipase